MLSDFKLFRNLSPDESEKLSAYFKQCHFGKKEQVEFSGQSQDYIYLVRSGRVKVSYLSPEGKEVIVTILQPGDIYSMHSEANTTVMEPAEIWYIGLENFKKIVMQNPGLTVNLIRILGIILKNTNDALLNLAFKEVNSRLADLLLKIARETGVTSDRGVVFEMGLTHEEIANIISSTRQTVTSILNRFEKAGIIDVQKKRITVKNMEQLAEMSK
ncbi:MAG: Crp/Fnr family transcriptional regulator [Eubacteriales bacterium]